jgi:hypothetical protein
MAGADTFDPKDAIILQNKGEAIVPILMNVLSTAKEFKDAVLSLSPEQKAFPESFRVMQLESIRLWGLRHLAQAVARDIVGATGRIAHERDPAHERSHVSLRRVLAPRPRGRHRYTEQSEQS